METGEVESPVKPFPPCTDQSSSYEKCSNTEKTVLLFGSPIVMVHWLLEVPSCYMGSLSTTNRFHLLSIVKHILRPELIISCKILNKMSNNL